MDRWRFSQKYREALTQELEARQGRLQALNRAMRELETQRILMGGRGGAAKEVVRRTKYAEKDRELPIDQLDDGVKRQRVGDSGGGRGGKVLPEAEVGLSSGARVWVSASVSSCGRIHPVQLRRSEGFWFCVAKH